MNPKVSVLMPVYNAALYLRQAIDSILNQTFTDFEFLIINDGSTDGSEQIIKSYTDPRIFYRKNTKNLGLVATLTLGIDLARGEYIARMDADDISLPERFARQIEFMDSHPEVGACGTAYQYFGDSSNIVYPPTDYKKAFTLLSDNSSLGHPTSMIRRSVLLQHGFHYEEKYQYAADFAFWIRIGQVAYLTSLPKVLLLYRWHANNMGKTDSSRKQAKTNARILWHELITHRVLTAPEKKYLTGEVSDWTTFQGGHKLLMAVLNDKTSTVLNKDYFSELTVTQWELNLIDCFGITGLMTCFLKPSLRKWSRATSIGLVAHYLSRHGIKLKRSSGK